MKSNETRSIEEILETIQCPICYLAMTSPMHTPMITPECGHTICSSCITKVRECPLCNRTFSTPVKNIAVSQIADILKKNNLIPIDLDPPAPSENKLIPKSIDGVCTYLATGTNHIWQKWYQCRTCNISGNLGFCEICARKCHKGHDVALIRDDPGFYCDCGPGKNCHCLVPTQNLRCTSEITYELPCTQPMYQCIECHISGDEFICQSCAIKCHYKHKLRYVGILRDKVCSCYKHSTCKITRKEPFCSYLISGENYIKQQWYHCITCGLVGNLGCCEACAKTCHKGHNVVYDYMCEKCFCDCGANKQMCKICKFPNKSYLNKCTNMDAETKGTEKMQRMYNCLTCGIDDPMGICEACAINCHINHSIVFVGMKKFTCMCGQNCIMERVPMIHNDRKVCDRKVLSPEDVSACYTCYTCDKSGNMKICETCALQKHLNHDVHLIGYMKFKCQ